MLETRARFCVAALLFLAERYGRRAERLRRS